MTDLPVARPPGLVVPTPDDVSRVSDLHPTRATVVPFTHLGSLTPHHRHLHPPVTREMGRHVIVTLVDP